MVQRLINNEWQGMGQDGVLSCFQIPSRYFEGLRKTRNVGQDNQFPRQNLTPVTQKKKKKKKKTGLINYNTKKRKDELQIN